MRSVPRAHAAWVAADDPTTEHALSETGGTLCGLPADAGETLRHLLEDLQRDRTCARCQALSDAVRAADLLAAVEGAVRRTDLTLPKAVGEQARALSRELLATYPPGTVSQPNFDVYYDRTADDLGS